MGEVKFFPSLSVPRGGDVQVKPPFSRSLQVCLGINPMRPSALGQEISVEPGNQALGEQWREINFPGGGRVTSPLFAVTAGVTQPLEWLLQSLLSLEGPGNSLSSTKKDKYEKGFQSTLKGFRHVVFLDGSRASPHTAISQGGGLSNRGRRRCGVKGIRPGSRPLSRRGTMLPGNPTDRPKVPAPAPSTMPRPVAIPLGDNMQATTTSAFINNNHGLFPEPLAGTLFTGTVSFNPHNRSTGCSWGYSPILQPHLNHRS